MVFTAFLLLLPFGAIAQDHWFVNFTPGLSIASPAPLRIQQKGFEDISFWARYRTNPLDMPIYYSFRGGYRKVNKLFEIEMNHLKLYLQNTTDQVEWFAVSHGYNQIFLNRGWVHPKTGQKIGVGMVLAHPENTVRGKRFDEKMGLLGKGYHLSGVAVQYVVFKEITVTKLFYFLIEAKASLSYSRIKVADGGADVPAAALHLLIGPGIKIKKGTSGEMPSY